MNNLQPCTRLLAEYHRRLGREAVLYVVRPCHFILRSGFSGEAALIPKRTAIVERFHDANDKKMTTTSEPRRPAPRSISSRCRLASEDRQ